MSKTLRSTNWRCPKCAGELQLTRKTYYSIEVDEDDGLPELIQVQADQPDVWHLYCENDHEIVSDFEADEADLISVVDDIIAGDPPATR